MEGREECKEGERNVGREGGWMGQRKERKRVEGSERDRREGSCT